MAKEKSMNHYCFLCECIGSIIVLSLTILCGKMKSLKDIYTGGAVNSSP